MTLDLPPIQSFSEFEAETLPLMKRRSRFGAVRWNEMRPGEGPQFEWLVDDLIPRGGVAMIAGASQSGKTFVTLDLAMAVARGTQWFGKDVAQGGVIYFAAEDPTGVRSLRVPAYREANRMSLDDDVPFTLLTERLNLWEAPERADELIEECKALQDEMGQTLQLIVIDTYAKATTGSDELSGKEMSVIMDRMDRINRETGATVLLVDHLNASGSRVRGVAPKTANIDAVLICRMATIPGERRGETIPATDRDNRKIRELSNDMEWGGKVKNGSAMAKPIRFVLPQVKLGIDAKGKEINSCVVAPPSGEEIASRERGQSAGQAIGAKLSIAMKALQAAIQEHGRPAPSHIPNPPSGSVCVTLAEWRDQLAPLLAEESEDPDKLTERVKKARDRAAETLIDRNYIRKHGDWVWRTGRRVPGMDRAEPKEAPAERPLAPLPDDLQSLEQLSF